MKAKNLIMIQIETKIEIELGVASIYIFRIFISVGHARPTWCNPKKRPLGRLGTLSEGV